ncbi:hypothetical protein PWG71_27090 [Nocardiopsis sp. N85]|uniref:hypothetical protein n=1 Tax=Nocardiopsis sp. N85 TaxID=3029400 RepID=UPI00237FBA25|nr:hypothetical protein [Nocardiopsis sp. N85]MDE3725064.1 hypothetical protein [Nocardiopsis sp. N85]
MDTTILIIIGVVAIVVIGVGAVLIFGTSKVPLGNTTRLKKRFGAEYDHVVTAHGGDTKAAERELSARLDRNDKIRLRTLTDEERARHRDAWLAVQREFVENPERSVQDSRRVLTAAMTDLGYPVEPSGTDTRGFEHHLADLSVDHGDEVAAVHRAEEPDTDTDTTGTERLREVLMAHRDLLDVMLDGPSRPRRAGGLVPKARNGRESEVAR